MKREIYVSTDIESDGPIPGPNSMLSLGSVALDADGAPLGEYSANLEPLPGATPDPRTMDWWRTQPAAYRACRLDPRPPAAVMPEYARWVEALPGTPIFVAYPAGFDFLFVYWYLVRFAGRSPFSHSALDLKTYAMCLLGCGYRDATKRRFPREWFTTKQHTHVALDDAREQGDLWMAMLRAARARAR
jgi:hypothetical protein